eukprot:m.12553 g.12553  ORF g.12553 m.12553 type:complete len:421 (-) comp9977_c0_seq1:101-1363(-)
MWLRRGITVLRTPCCLCSSYYYASPFIRTMADSIPSTPPAKPGKRRKPKTPQSPLESPSPHRSKKADVAYPISALVAKSLLRDLSWTVLAKPEQVNFNYSLQCGQSFAWQQINESLYCGTIDGVPYLCYQDTDQALYHCLDPEVPAATASAQLHQYFQLDTCLHQLYASWSMADNRLASIAKSIPGVRVLQQPPLECLISFICSSNNNIPRITQMLNKLKVTYGRKVTTFQSIDLYQFPSLDQLKIATEKDLRDFGFGYRAKFIVQTCTKLVELGGEPYLLKLRCKPAAEVREELLQLAGVGPKVADCIALFSLDQHDVIPVDTHVWQIAVRDYDPTLSQAKSLTPTIYKRVGDLFRERFGTHAGWAHSLLFAAELPLFASLLPVGLVKEMSAFKQHEKELKAQKKRLKKGKQEKGDDPT